MYFRMYFQPFHPLDAIIICCCCCCCLRSYCASIIVMRETNDEKVVNASVFVLRTVFNTAQLPHYVSLFCIDGMAKAVHKSEKLIFFRSSSSYAQKSNAYYCEIRGNHISRLFVYLGGKRKKLHEKRKKTKKIPQN